MVTESRLQTLDSGVATVGSLRSPETTTISADVSGIIVALDAPEGREIEKGHLIARLDEKESRASLQVAEARHRNANIALDRARPLVEDGVASEKTLDDAKAEMATAEGLLEEARTRVDKTQIRAPFTGLVGIQTAQLGQFVSSGDAIIELTQVDPLELVFGVPEENATDVRIGQTIQARVGRCGESFEAIVEARDPRIDPDSRSLSVQARVDNSQRRLIPGMSARLRLTIGSQREAVVVPREALAAQGASYVLWVVGEESQVQPRNVVPGEYFPDVVEIREGLEAGVTIVVAGHQKLRPGGTIVETPWVPTENAHLELGTRGADDCVGGTIE